MENLPANQKSGSTPSLPERAAHREWIGGRVLTLLSHYWRDDDPVELTAAIGADWADVLEGLPQKCIQAACIKYQRDEGRRKPTPGAIYQLARELMPRPEVVRSAPPVSETTRFDPISDEDLAERRKAADEIVRAAGFSKKMETKK